MKLAIRHSTHYAYDRPVSHGLQRLRLRPKTSHGQHVLAWDMALTGARVEVEYDDYLNNHIALVSVDPGTLLLDVTCTGLIETVDNAGVIGPHTGYLPLWYFLDDTALTRAGPQVRALAGSVAARESDALARLHLLSERVFDAVRYEVGRTDTQTTAEQALIAGHGVCQDHAHVFVAAARAMGIPARYVSGYLMLTDRIDQEASHGWAEAHVDGLGWVGFDVSNRTCPMASHVRVASGRDYGEAAPVTGLIYGEGESTLHVSLAVEQQVVEQ